VGTQLLQGLLSEVDVDVHVLRIVDVRRVDVVDHWGGGLRKTWGRSTFDISIVDVPGSVGVETFQTYFTHSVLDSFTPIIRNVAIVGRSIAELLFASIAIVSQNCTFWFIDCTFWFIDCTFWFKILGFLLENCTFWFIDCTFWFKILGFLLENCTFWFIDCTFWFNILGSRCISSRATFFKINSSFRKEDI
jgi:hypothetical protein